MSDPIQHVTEQLPQYIDQQLPDAERAAVEAHLQICAECEVKRQELVQLRENPIEPEATPPAAPAPEEVDALLRQDLTEKPASRLDSFKKFKLEGRSRRLAIATGVGVVLGLISWQLQMRSGPSGVTPPPPLDTPPAPAETPAPPMEALTAASTDAMIVSVSSGSTPLPPATPPAATYRPETFASGGDSVAELRALVAKASGKRKSGKSVTPPAVRAAIKEVAEAPAVDTAITEPPILPAETPIVAASEEAVTSNVLTSTESDTIPANTALMEWQGLNSAVRKFQTFVVRTPEEMKSLWQKHSPGTSAPDVNFERYMVVGVTQGQTRIRGSAIEVMGSRPSTDGLTVYYREITAAAGQMPRMSAYTPYHFKVVPKSSLKVSFQSL